jgi:lipoate-protein ligase B
LSAESGLRMVRRVADDGILIQRWGTVPYAEALERQLRLHAERVAGLVPDTLVLVGHPPTFTLGRHAPAEDLVLDPGEIERRGVAVARSDRGGRATYHGPGQAVLYPVVAIEERGLGVKDWVCLLESALLDTLADYGLRGERRPGTAGIWTVADTARGQGGAKIASLGLRVARGVSYHGVALNTGLDASIFDAIVTCGVRGERVTTIAMATGRAPGDDEAGEVLAGHVARRLKEQQDARSARRASGPACRTADIH